MTGSEIFIESLLKEGVEHIFGYPGGVLLSIYDVLYRTPELNHILVRHEQGAAYMAYGYALSTGKTGVCLVVPGAGLLNASAALSTVIYG